MAKTKKTTETPESHLEPEPFTPTYSPPPPPPPPLPSYPAEKLTQKEAVTRAMAAGKEGPTEGVEYIREEFGMTISTQIFSTLKSQIRKASGAPALRTRSSTPTARPSPYPTRPPQGKTGDLVRTIRNLIEAFGPDAVREVTEALAD